MGFRTYGALLGCGVGHSVTTAADPSGALAVAYARSPLRGSVILQFRQSPMQQIIFHTIDPHNRAKCCLMGFRTYGALWDVGWDICLPQQRTPLGPLQWPMLVRLYEAPSFCNADHPPYATDIIFPTIFPHHILNR